MLLHTGKPHGLRTARKLRNHRRDQKWHDKDYKKSHLGTRWKSNPFGGASHAKGIVLEKVYVANVDFFVTFVLNADRICQPNLCIRNFRESCVGSLVDSRCFRIALTGIDRTL